MASVKPGTLSATALVGMLLLLLLAAGCSSDGNEAVDLLRDPNVGLSHLNDEFHAIKGEDLLANPQFGLAHLNEELHTIRTLATDPKLGFQHLNDELHTVKELLAELADQVQALVDGAG